MSAPGHARVFPLTMRWYLAVWCGGGRLQASTIRAREDGRPRVIGLALSVLGCTVTLGQFGTTPGSTPAWHRDFGERLGRFTISGWRTIRRVPVSTGWVIDGLGRRNGILVTIASRTVYVARLATRAEVQYSRYYCGDMHKKKRR